MYDLGDLREGFFNREELIEMALHIERQLTYVKLKGIGTNLGCYGGVKPTTDNLKELCNASKDIEKKIGRKLEIVSGGATSSIPLLLENKIPEGINHLRVGEGILINRDLPDIWNVPVLDLYQNTFILKAQVVEVKDKPSYPIGEIFIDAFGNKPAFNDQGIRKRAILAVGKQDFGSHNGLVPLVEGVEIIGSSSDHLIADVENCKKNINVGDVIEFGMFYESMLCLTGAKSVKKIFSYR